MCSRSIRSDFGVTTVGPTTLISLGLWTSGNPRGLKPVLQRISFRWHDLRHIFVSRLAENPAVSEQTITALAGHVGRRMLERYRHIRTEAKRAIESLETGQISGPWAQ